MPDPKRKPERTTPHKEKLCKACRKPFVWTEKRALDWDVAKFCSFACGGYEPGEKAGELEAAILELLRERGRSREIDPTAVAKMVGGTEARRDWEALLEPSREAARRLVKARKAVVIQKDKVIEVSALKGPFLLRLP